MEQDVAPPSNRPVNDLLLIAADVEERRLLFAELLEAGYDVLPLPSLSQAIRLLSRRVLVPPLILVDMGAEGGEPNLIERLLAVARGVPLVLVAGAMNKPGCEPFRSKVAAVLHRPVSIGEIVAAVRRILPPHRPGSTERPADTDTARRPV